MYECTCAHEHSTTMLNSPNMWLWKQEVKSPKSFNRKVITFTLSYIWRIKWWWCQQFQVTNKIQAYFIFLEKTEMYFVFLWISGKTVHTKRLPIKECYLYLLQLNYWNKIISNLLLCNHSHNFFYKP